MPQSVGILKLLRGPKGNERKSWLVSETPGSGVLKVVVVPSPFLSTKSRTGLLASLSSATSTDWKRVPLGTKKGGTGSGLKPFEVFSIGPLWQMAHIPS